MGALALCDVTPGSRYVARSKDVLQEVKRKSLVGQHGARECRALFRAQRFLSESRRLLHRAKVVPPEHADSIDLSSGPERGLQVFPARDVWCSAGNQEVRIVGSCPRCILGVGALQADVGDAERIDALSPCRLALKLLPPIAELGGGAIVAWLHRRCLRDMRQVHLQLRRDVGNREDPLRVGDCVEQLFARARMVPAIADIAAQSIQSGATPCAVSAPASPQALFVADACLGPEASNSALRLGIRVSAARRKCRGVQGTQASAGPAVHMRPSANSNRLAHCGPTGFESHRRAAGRACHVRSSPPPAERSSSMKRNTASSRASRG